MINISDSAKPYKEYDHAEKIARGVHFTIDYNGNWYFHNGAAAGPIRRQKLAALFGGAGEGFMAGKGLFIDEDGLYWLKSPDGQYQVEVEDVPFLITGYNVKGAGNSNQAIDLITNFDEIVALGSDHPLIVKSEPLRGVDVFYVEVRKGLLARFSKSVFHDIISTYVEYSEIDSSDNSIQGKAVLRSRGTAFALS